MLHRDVTSVRKYDITRRGQRVWRNQIAAIKIETNKDRLLVRDVMVHTRPEKIVIDRVIAGAEQSG